MKTEANQKRNIELLQRDSLNWRRIMSAIKRSSPHYRSADKGVHESLGESLAQVEQILRALCDVVGYWSISRKVMTNIGKVLLQHPDGVIDIICPICITYAELTSSKLQVPQVVLDHLRFLKNISDVLPNVKITFLFPTHEKGKSGEKLRGLYEMTRVKCLESGCDIIEMSEYIPHIEEEVGKMIEEIHAHPERFRFIIEMVEKERSHYYAVNGITDELRRKKVVQLVAEFLTLGKVATSRGALICSVTTGRIRCFTAVGAGVLHNPISCNM